MKLHKRILTVVFALQLVFVFSMTAIGIINEKNYETKAQVIKVHVNEIFCYRFENILYVSIYDNKRFVEKNMPVGGYYCFNEVESGIYEMNYSRTKPKDRLCVAREENDEMCMQFQYSPKTVKTDVLDKMNIFELDEYVNIYSDSKEFYSDKYDFYNLYEVASITEHPSNAYALIKVYNGKYEFIDLYVDDIQIEQYINDIATGKVDLTEFNKQCDAIKAEREKYGDSF